MVTFSKRADVKQPLLKAVTCSLLLVSFLGQFLSQAKRGCSHQSFAFASFSTNGEVNANGCPEHPWVTSIIKTCTS